MSQVDMSGVEATGLPRPLVRYDKDHPDRRLPLPWINTKPDEAGWADFYAFREDCSRSATERLCCICGDPLRHYVTVAAMGGDRATSGGWGHPRCIQIAVRLCPHFDRLGSAATVAWLHEGDGIGVAEPCFEVDEVAATARPMDRDDLAWLARTNPWGDNDQATHPPTPHGEALRAGEGS